MENSPQMTKLSGKDKYIVGISYGYHDSAVCLVYNGKVLNAVEEERFTGIKHDNSFPINSIEWILGENNLKPSDISYVCYYENPFLKNERIKSIAKKTFWKNPIDNFKLLFRKREKVEDDFRDVFHKGVTTIFCTHHEAHQAYSYYTSKFSDSAVLTVDGVGEFETTTLSYWRNNIGKQLSSVEFPHSLGMLYSTITAFLGFKPNEGEYKVMGLAPYGTHLFHHKKFDKLIRETENGFELNEKYFSYQHTDKVMFNTKLSELLGIPNRLPDEPINDIHMNIAAALQYTYEKHFFSLLNKLHNETKSDNLCLGGGCAYNGTANGKILDNTPFKHIWIPPAPSDAGSAIGSALLFYYTNTKGDRIKNETPFLGPSQDNQDFTYVLRQNEDRVYGELIVDNKLLPKVAKLISEGNIVGWVQGKLEFGARALGNRSILADPRDPQMKRRVNMVVKKREGFRPFAPMVTFEDRVKFFTPSIEVPYMNQIIKVKDNHKENLPAITHIDGSARVQTLRKDSNLRMYRLLEEFGKITNYPILLNTSFNLKDQTMVRDAQEAIDTFMNCDMDYLILGNYLVSKKII